MKPILQAYGIYTRRGEVLPKTTVKFDIRHISLFGGLHAYIIVTATF